MARCFRKSSFSEPKDPSSVSRELGYKVEASLGIPWALLFITLMNRTEGVGIALDAELQ